MKATGIVRRIDDLGRVVIPKEIRRTMRIREGDPLEIYTASDGEVIFKKYSPIGEISTFATQYADVLFKNSHMPILITDRDRVIAVSGANRKEFLNKHISEDLGELIENRSNYKAEPNIRALYPLESSQREAGVAYPIIGGGDISGAVIMLLSEDGNMPTDTQINMVSIAADFLGKQTEE